MDKRTAISDLIMSVRDEAVVEKVYRIVKEASHARGRRRRVDNENERSYNRGHKERYQNAKQKGRYKINPEGEDEHG